MLRDTVWSDLLRVSIIELEEKKVLIRNYPNYQRNLSVFENLMEIASKYDCVAFRQIDQDISEFRFPAHYYEETTDQGSSMGGYKMSVDEGGEEEKVVINRANKLKQDKQKMRKLLRILIVWGKNFKHKGVDYQFSYTSGFLKLAHRLINMMSLEKAFWIVVGMVRQYPRLWCLEESTLLDDAKSLFRFELTVIRSILEANFPSVSRKLYELGISPESLVYEQITSLYSNVFHSDTLFRIWDQMIFYFNMNDQKSKKKGIWMILAPAILIISQKKDEILKCRTV